MSLDTERYKKNLRDELDGSTLYAPLATAETDPSGKICFSSCRKPKPSMRRYGATPARVLTPDSLRRASEPASWRGLRKDSAPDSCFLLLRPPSSRIAINTLISKKQPSSHRKSGARARCRASRRAHRRRYREGGTLARAWLRQRAARSRPGRERWSNVEPVPGHGNGRRRSAVAHYNTGAHLYPSFVLIVLHSRYH